MHDTVSCRICTNALGRLRAKGYKLTLDKVFVIRSFKNMLQVDAKAVETA